MTTNTSLEQIKFSDLQKKKQQKKKKKSDI